MQLVDAFGQGSCDLDVFGWEFVTVSSAIGLKIDVFQGFEPNVSTNP